MQYQLLITLDKTKFFSSILEQVILHQTTQVVMRKRFSRIIYNQQSYSSIIHQQHRKVSRYNGSFIWKETRSSVQHSHQVLYLFTSRLSTNYSTIFCCSEKFTNPTNPYSSQYIPPKTHDLALQPPLQHLLLSLLPHLI